MNHHFALEVEPRGAEVVARGARVLLETDEANDGDPDAAGAPERKAALLVAVAEEKGYHEQDEHYGAEGEDVEIRRFGEGFKGGEEIEGIVVAVNVTAGRRRRKMDVVLMDGV